MNLSFKYNLTLINKLSAWWLVIILALCWGAWLRITSLSSASFWLDEAFSIEAAQLLLNPETSSVNNWTRGFIHHHLLAQIINFFGESEFSVRSLSVISGIALVVVIMQFSLRNFGIRAAAASSVLMSLSYWQIAWSRQAREYILLTLVFWLGILILNKLWHMSISKWVKTFSMTAITIVAIGVHWFGALLVASIFFKWIAQKTLHSYKFSSFYPLVISIIATCITIYVLRSHFNMSTWWLNVYSSFLLKSYWPLLLLSVLSILIVNNAKKRETLLWIGLTCLFGFLIISTAIPMVNMRYIFFLTPVLIIFTAAGLESIKHRNYLLFALVGTISLYIITYTKVIIWKPSSEYTLESQKTRKGLNFFTPQPDFKSAYNYINEHIEAINLITPYPVISRRYRTTDDVLAFDSNMGFLPQSQKKQEYEELTKVPFANIERLKQAFTIYDNLYFLVDDMYLQRISYKAQKTIYTPEKIVQSWRHPPYSSLYLFRIK